MGQLKPNCFKLTFRVMTNWDNLISEELKRAKRHHPRQSLTTGLGALFQRVNGVAYYMRENKHINSDTAQTHMAMELLTMSVICQRMFERLDKTNFQQMRKITQLSDQINHPDD